MTRVAAFAALALLASATAAACQKGAPGSAPEVRAREIRRFSAAEARQGVAVDSNHFYAVANTRIGKYDKQTGAKVGEWIEDSGRIKHLNSCVAEGVRLVCAHSNYPSVPMSSSIEIFDGGSMRHLESIGLSTRIGSLTWVEQRDGVWWGGFANYDGRGGEKGRDHRQTTVVRFEEGWGVPGGYRFPASVLERFAPMSSSGGSWGTDGLLYVTGHDAQEIYVLRVPDEGAVLEYVATIAAPLEGQAWAWDRSGERLIYGITRGSGEVVVMEVPVVEQGSGPPAAAGRGRF